MTSLKEPETHSKHQASPGYRVKPMLALNSRPSRLSLPSAGTAVLHLHTGLYLPTGVRVLGAGERRPAQGDFEAEGGAATPERGAEGA